MRLLPGSSRRLRIMGFDMTPMIDVVLQLIIFFMYTTQFSQQVRSEVQLPFEVGDEEVVEESGEIVIDLRADATYMAGGEQASLERVVEMIRAEVEQAASPADVRVLIRPDRDAPAGALNKLAERLARLGVTSWRWGTERPRGEPGPGGRAP